MFVKECHQTKVADLHNTQHLVSLVLCLSLCMCAVCVLCLQSRICPFITSNFCLQHPSVFAHILHALFHTHSTHPLGAGHTNSIAFREYSLENELSLKSFSGGWSGLPEVIFLMRMFQKNNLWERFNMSGPLQLREATTFLASAILFLPQITSNISAFIKSTKEFENGTFSNPVFVCICCSKITVPLLAPNAIMTRRLVCVQNPLCCCSFEHLCTLVGRQVVKRYTCIQGQSTTEVSFSSKQLWWPLSVLVLLVPVSWQMFKDVLLLWLLGDILPCLCCSKARENLGLPWSMTKHKQSFWHA